MEYLVFVDMLQVNVLARLNRLVIGFEKVRL
jgi:hypothetical protein